MSEPQGSFRTFDAITRRWWFFVAVVLVQFLPAVTTRNFDYGRMHEIISVTLGRALFYRFDAFYPVFQVAAIAVIVLLLVLRNKARTLFAVHAGASYGLFIVMQLVAVTPEYGLSVLPGGVVLFGLVAAAWFWEARAGVSDYSPRSRPAWRYLLLAPAILAFWLPMDLSGLGPDFSPWKVITSGSALTFCMMTPVYLAVLIFFLPDVNTVVLRITAAVGVILALYNVPMLFVPEARWNGFLHLPLLGLSVLGLVLSFRRSPGRRARKQSLPSCSSACR